MFARILGPLFLLGIAALAALAGLLLAPLTTYRRTGRLKWPSALADRLASLLLCELFRLFGKQTQIVEPKDKLIAEMAGLLKEWMAGNMSSTLRDTRALLM